MSHSLSFVELINLAIGTPELGNVNFNALHLFLHSLVEHLQLQDVRKEVTADELEFVKPPPSTVASVATSSETVPVAHESSSIFHQMHERITAIEKQLRFLNDTPDTAELLVRTQGVGQPTQDMWQMMQLKKKMELNEEGMTKAMNTLQDLLNNICSLKTATDGFQQELGQLKENIVQLNGEEMKERLRGLDEQARMMEEMKEQLDLVKERVSMSADASDVVCWSALCETLTGRGTEEEEEEEGGREKTSREILAVLGQLPEKHEALLKHMTQLEAQLKYPGVFEIPPELKSLLERMEMLQTQSKQGKESLQGTLEQMERLKEQYEKLQKGVERLTRSTSDIQVMRNMLEQLDIKKADKDLIQEEMNVKADKSALEAMVNHGELQIATSQLNEMMQDLLQKMSLQDKDWQKALEKLFVDMDCKLDRMALDPVSRQLEEVWRFIKKYLSEGPRFDADSAAGFKKQLFERVKCISCDRPVTMMTGPHMITVRRATLRPRPASANGYEYLSQQQKRDHDPSEMSGNLPLQTCWQCQAHHQACTLKHLSRSQDLTTLYPYGDPTAITYDNTEVDILGVNGVLYKGRVSSQAAERAFALQKEFAALKFPRPPTGVRMERVRSAFADISTVPYPPSVLRRVGSAIANSNRQPPQLSCDPVDRTIISATLSHSHVQNGRDIPGL
ncbi:uncharacterized protein C16orf96 homolog [Python bivittatus]|uniref:Uncharacterized protein C16orf96 homolog n=1 Tax=Python bivittatus TaxID=176946 RepID=A0A9F2R4C0_PYTBI|nr:uncharacterized protein C16orf96 homolog [Python bivittatus]